MSEINTKDTKGIFLHALATAVVTSAHATPQKCRQFLNHLERCFSVGYDDLYCSATADDVII